MTDTVELSALTLPLVDLSRFHAPAPERAAFIAEVRQILFDHGFFYLTGHGVAPALIEETVTAAKRFFAQPLEEKLKIEMVKSPHFRGYNRAGNERTRGAQDWREQIDFNTEGEAQQIGPDTPVWNRLHGPNQWPEAVPELKPAILAYQAEVTRVARDVLKLIASALGQHEDAFAQIYQPHPTQLLKIIRYPGRDVAQTDQGVGAHKDGGFVTVLLQDRIEGLRVQGADGSWVSAPPVPGTFVINTGELLELATNGFVRAAVHDVVAPPAGVERFSVAFFFGAHYDAQIPVIELPEELQQRQRGVTSDPGNPIFRSVGQNTLKSRLRSHPDVARVHYPDLVAETEAAG